MCTMTTRRFFHSFWPGATKIGLNEGAGGRTSIWPIKKDRGPRGGEVHISPSTRRITSATVYAYIPDFAAVPSTIMRKLP
jgi:hypothetical protein